MLMRRLTLVCPDGRSLAARHYPATAPRGLLIVSPATAVPQRFYEPFAQHFAQRGWDVLTWDARGIGDSRQGPSRQDPVRMRDWGQLDLEAALQHAASELAFAWQDISVIGHSSGGHLSALAPSLQRVPRLALIASGTCHWRDYPKAQWPRVLLGIGLAFPLLCSTLGHVPAWAGIGQDLPPGVAREWRRWCLTPGYLFGDGSLDSRGYERFAGEVLALSVTDDRGFSPPATVDDLLARFTAARIQHRPIHPPDHGLQRLGHFGYFKREHAVLWSGLEDWLRASSQPLQGQEP